MYSTPQVRRGVLACTGAALLSVVMPGTGHWAIRAPLRRAVIVAATLNIVATVLLVALLYPARDRAAIAALAANRTSLVALASVLLALAGSRAWTALDVAWQARPVDGGVLKATAGFIVAVLVLAVVGPIAVAAEYVWQTDRAIERVFASDEATTAYPSMYSTRNASLPATATRVRSTTTTIGTTEPSTTTMIAATTTSSTTSTTTTTTTTLPPIVAVNRVNVLLLGGDAGPGRWSLRTDTMVVVSIDPVTGDTVMISVPRNLARLPFPAGTALAARFPRGFNDIANAVYPYVNQRRELAGGGDDAGAQAVKLGIAQLLGMPIHYFVLVDMAGFVDVVDALDGIEISVPRRVPSPGNPPNAKHDVPAWIEAGRQHMDGTLALAYARSRSADSDYNRMARQRCVLGAIANAATPMALASGLGELVAAFGAAVRTDIPRDRLGEFALLLDRVAQAGGMQAVRTLHLAPPLVGPRTWDALHVRLLVTAAIEPSPSALPTGPDGQPAAPATPTLADRCS